MLICLGSFCFASGNVAAGFTPLSIHVIGNGESTLVSKYGLGGFGSVAVNIGKTDWYYGCEISAEGIMYKTMCLDGHATGRIGYEFGNKEKWSGYAGFKYGAVIQKITFATSFNQIIGLEAGAKIAFKNSEFFGFSQLDSLVFFPSQKEGSFVNFKTKLSVGVGRNF